MILTLFIYAVISPIVLILIRLQYNMYTNTETVNVMIKRYILIALLTDGSYGTEEDR